MKFMKMLKHGVLAALVCVSAWGASVDTVSADPAGMEAFKEAMTKNNSFDKRVFREQLNFFLPSVKADIDFQGVSRNEKELLLDGSFTGIMTDNKGNTQSLVVPFCLEQKKNKMAVYYKLGEEWTRIDAPELSAAVVDSVGTPNEADLQDMISMVKSAEVLQETDNQRTMLLNLDAAALSKKLDTAFADEKDEKITPEQKATREQFLGYVKKGLESTDIWCTWTVDKKDWQTITFSMDLSGIIHGIAKAALDDRSLELSDGLRSMLESLAFYSELKSYTTYLNPDTKKTINLPKEIKNAKTFEEALAEKKDGKAEAAAK